jgi:hypothetical protein
VRRFPSLILDHVGKNEVRQKLAKILLIVAPAAFLLKDIVATNAVLSTEPGVTAKAARYYSIATLPGPLFVESSVMLFNFIFGALLGLILYLCLRFKNIWLLIIPPSAFLLKDIIALATAVLSTEPGISAKAARYYSIAMLPGSMFSKILDPMLFNFLFGAVIGIFLYLHVVRNATHSAGS